MTFYLTNDFLVLSVFFFFVAWGFTKAFLWAGVLLKGAVFFVSFSLFITLEQMDSIEMTVASLLGALTALGGGLTNGLYTLKNSLENMLYWVREALGFLLSPFIWLFFRVRQTIIDVISLFKSQPQTDSNRQEKPQQSRKHTGGNNHNKGQDKKEQRQKAKEQFRQAQEEAEKKRVEEEFKKNSNKADYQDNRSFEEILGVQAGYTKGELKTAYKRVASRFHPDKYSHMSEVFRLEAEEEFKKIQRAYSILLRSFLDYVIFAYYALFYCYFFEPYFFNTLFCWKN